MTFEKTVENSHKYLIKGMTLKPLLFQLRYFLLFSLILLSIAFGSAFTPMAKSITTNNGMEKSIMILKPTPTPVPSPGGNNSKKPSAAFIADLPVVKLDLDYISYRYHSWDIPDETSIGSGIWLEVDLTNQILYAYRDNQLISGFKVSTGTDGNETVTGVFKIYSKYPSIKMTGPGYDLPGVPYSMFFYKGFALHGTYWHHNFGTPMSHGCVNMYTPDAAWVYENAPVGTYVMVHY
jgi:hypothetical protein